MSQLNLEDLDIRHVEDKIEVKGSGITSAEKPAIIAAEVKKGNEILTLCDEKGFPVWAGWKRR